jgi:hypothetical protein
MKYDPFYGERKGKEIIHSNTSMPAPLPPAMVVTIICKDKTSLLLSAQYITSLSISS